MTMHHHVQLDGFSANDFTAYGLFFSDSSLFKYRRSYNLDDSFCKCEVDGFTGLRKKIFDEITSLLVVAVIHVNWK